MKTRYLKKLRKRYSWKWKPDSINSEFGSWVILDHKKKEVLHWYSAHAFISQTLSDAKAYEFDHRQRERARNLKYIQQLKEFKL